MKLITLFDCDTKQKVAFYVKEAILEYITKRKKYEHEQMEKTWKEHVSGKKWR